MTELKIESYTDFSNNDFQRVIVANNDLYQSSADSLNLNHTSDDKPVSSAINVKMLEPSPEPRLPYLRQSVALNLLNVMSKRDFEKYEIVRCDRTGENVIEIKKATDSGELTITIRSSGALLKPSIKPSMQKLFRFLIFKFTQQGSSSKSRVIEVTLAEYMKYCGRRDKKETRKQLKYDLDLLNKIDLSYRCNNRNSEKALKMNLVKTSICESSPTIEDSVIKFELTEGFLDYLLLCPAMPISPSIFKIDIRTQQYTWKIANKIFEQRRFNNGKANQNIIGVRSLTELCICPIKDIKRFAQLVKKPLEQALDYLTIFGIEWIYQNKFGEKVTDRQLKKINDNTMTKEEFLDLQINIHIIDYPDIKTPKRKSKKTRKNR